MLEYENYEYYGKIKSGEKERKVYKMKRPIEDRDRGRKLNHRPKKTKPGNFNPGFVVE